MNVSASISACMLSTLRPRQRLMLALEFVRHELDQFV
jgi:hypothetical protein